ncbi:unnamed protein product [Adineta steineri]|uniref:G-protein coupled receptors family 1 profile domain-containing protein n=1 Tax=Adineta steineri TaxID=433720 RepID=A0A814JFG7_9BILA|nr:unnamed protein product [Adineta steineri]CAF3977192.1 unnamed protein product [Adineta steineri]CAF4093837.1 unnamed protein product [Adineta steineri]
MQDDEFEVYFCRSTAFWLIALACADRYFCSSSSANRRSWSSIRVASRAIPLTILLNFLVYIHIPIFFRLDINPTTLKPVCYSTGPIGPYRSFLTYCNLIIYGICPSLCMFVFGILTVRHINQRRRVHVAPVTITENRQRNERQILRMLLVQVAVYSVTGIAFSVGIIITAVITSQPLNVLQAAQANLANAIIGVFSLVGPCLSFYLFTLSSRLFRKELKRLVCKVNEHVPQSQADQRGTTAIRPPKQPTIPIT